MSFVLCLGEILWDCIADQVADTPDRVTSWTAYPGGAPANVATALKKLGTPSGFIGCVGTDAAGNALVERLTHLQVNTQGIQRHPTAPTRQIEVLRTTSGDRQFHKFRGGTTDIFADAHLQAANLPEHLFESADFLVLGTLELAYPETRAAIEQSLALAQQHQVKVLIDINWRSMFWTNEAPAKSTILSILPYADMLKLSDEEAEWLFATQDPVQIRDRIHALPSPHAHSHPAIGILITAGNKGCTYWLNGSIGKQPAFPVPVQDTTGAGDSFVAGFLHQLLQHDIDSLTCTEPLPPSTAQEIMTYASAVGALTTTKLGAIDAQPTAAAVAAFLQNSQSLS